MDYFFDPNRLPPFLVPFVSLSYRVDPPPNPDSFSDSSYYDIGYLDVCLIVTIIATMAILRDAARIFLFEPFANWKLTRDWRRRQALKSGSATPDSKAGIVKPNGRINGRVTTIGSAEKLVADRPADHSPEARRIRHAVVRFAEQGWQVVYYSWQWSLGVVRVSYHLLLEMRLLISVTVHSLLPSLERLDRVPPYTPSWHYQNVLSHADISLLTSCPSSQR
jgi:very-long-chain ceramide synthase